MSFCLEQEYEAMEISAVAVILWPWKTKLKDKYQHAEGTRVEDSAMDWMFISPVSSDVEILIPDGMALGG